jgi:hypothetical protein
LSNIGQYKENEKEAIKIFRPILQALKIREENNHRPVFLAEFDDLAFLNLDQCSIQFAVGKIDAASLFVVKYTKQGLLKAFIILNKKLFADQSKKMRIIRKIAGVHEFIHFIAMIYLATVTRTSELRSALLQRLQRTINKLWDPALDKLYQALSGQINESEFTPPELTDSHFRLGNEGKTPDYDVLFLYFMFSRELFEIYFDETKQKEFRELYSNGQTDQAIQLLLGTLEKAANDKDVPYNTARNQLFQWVHVYMRPIAA